MRAATLPDGSAVRWLELPGRGPAVVTVHGLGSSSPPHFLPVLTGPGLSGRRAVLVDLPGFGLSDRPAGFDYSVESHAGAVARVLEELDAGPVDLVGHSLGGAVAVYLAHQRPELVRRLVAIEPNLDPWDGTASVSIARQPWPAFLDAGYAALLESAGPAWRATLRWSDPLALHRTAVGLCRGSQPVMRQALVQLRVPATLVWGGRSDPPAGLAELTAAGIGYAEVPGAGHVPMEDDPQGLTEVLVAALGAGTPTSATPGGVAR